LSGFELSKWYADCVTEEGAAAIVYHAELRWRAMTLHYSSLLKYTPGNAVRIDYSLRNRPGPAVHEDRIEWCSADWKAAGSWDELGPSHRNLLFESENGLLDWNCAAPRAAATMQVGDGPALNGWGYAEHLRLTIAPWRLPIRRLRWGRFVNHADALVWIDWSGTYNKRVAYLNGAMVDDAEISNSEIGMAERSATLSLDQGVVLREGKLGATALSIIPNLGRLFPDSMLNVHERKWLSHAVLRRPGQADSVGMAIHEVVEWP
jgi:hypothetical protein